MRLRQDANGKSRHTENSYYIFHAYPLSTPPGKIRRKQGLNFTLRDSQRERDYERYNQDVKLPENPLRITDTSLAWEPESKAVRQKTSGQF